MTKTNAARLLENAGIPFTLREYPFDEDDLSAVHAADALGIPPERLFKTLVARGADGECRVFCIPGAAELNLKKAAKAADTKSVALIPLKDLLPVAGYIRGGCSPIGMKKPFPVYIDETAECFDRIGVSAGARGASLMIDPTDLARFVNAAFADLV
jgi:Cys-tRNA(Pro)/Cys-tRNA(Cys) deacylase